MQLLGALHDIVATGSTFGYDTARDVMFGSIDDPDAKNAITELYSGKVYKQVSGRLSADRQDLTAEHSWPQSEGAREEAKNDLHHLFPAINTMNTRRSNLPYGTVDKAIWSTDPIDGIDEVSVLGTDADGNKVFEPRPSVQGDVARAQLYFFTRYNSDKPDDYTLNNFKVSLPTLLKWHAEDPPDKVEKARNDAIFGVQHNRNPYVDHPGWVDDIDFTKAYPRKRS